MSKALATKNVAAVLVALSLALGFTFAFVQPAKADTVSDLQAQVQALLAQIASLQGTTTTSTGTGCYTFTQNLSQGASGGEVMWVQQFLNGHGYTVAATGAGSPGNESTYFGALTKAAVVKFQNAYASSILTPVGLTAGTGYWGPSTRAEANALCAGSTTTTTTTTGTTGNGLGISVTAAAQPANSLAPALANRVPFTTFTLTNNSGAAVTINGIDVQRTGLAADAAFSGVELIDQNGLQIGTSRTFNSNNQTEIGTPWTLAAGASMTYTVAGNIACVPTPSSSACNSTYAGQVASLEVTGIDTTVPVSGTLPITGASQTINSSLVIGTASVQRSSYDPDSSRNESIGTTGLIFSGVRINAGSAENEKLFSITWNQTGSVGSSDLSNLVTIVNGTSYPMTVDSTGKYYTATFPGGIAINEGVSVDAYVQGDITGSDAAGRTVEFDIYRPSDIYLVGQTYGYGITPTSSGGGSYVASGNTSSGFTSGNPFYYGATMTITAGTLSTFSSSGSVGSQNIGLNVPNQPLGGFTTDFTGEPVTVQSMTFDVATNNSTSSAVDQLQNVTLVDQNGNVVAGPVNAVGNVLTFNSSVTFPVGAMTYTLKGTVPSDYPDGSTIQLSTNPSSWTGAQGEESGTTISFSGYSTINMATMTVQSGSLVVSAASTPAATTVAPGANNVVLANINLDASQSGEDVRLSSLPIVVNYTSGGSPATAANLAANLTNCQLYNGTTALNNQAVGGTGSNGWSTTNAPELEANFIFQNSITIPKGTVTTLTLECNISSSIGQSVVFNAGVNSNYDSTLLPTGVESGNSISPTVTPSSSGTMTTGTASLMVTVPTPTSYTQVAGGTTGVTVGTFTLQPTSDTVNLQQVGLALNSDYASSSDVSRAYIYNSAGTQVGSVIFTGSPVSLNGSSAHYYVATSTITTGTSVPQNVQSVYTIKADINQIGTGQAAMSGHEVRIGLSDAHGVGSSSGTSVDSGPATMPTTGPAIFRSYPVLAASSYLPSNGIADGRLIAFSITANSNNAVGLDKLSFTLSTSTAIVSAPALYVYTDSGFSQAAGGGNNGVYGTTVESNNSVVTTFNNPSPLEIPAGTTEYFLLKGTVSDVTTGSNVATTLLGDTTDDAPTMYVAASVPNSNEFIWSPNSTTTSVATNPDWTNGFGVNGLPSIGITQNRTN